MEARAEIMGRVHSIALAVIALAASATFAESAQPGKRPNVLFVAVDDLNDWVGCLGGHPGAKTPHIDRLAARGVLFTRAYCAAPACNPSRVALLTGLRPSTTGVYHNNQPWRPVPVLRRAVTLPQHFMRHGYHVAGCGKIFHGGFDDPASWHEYRPGGRAGLPRPPAPTGRAGGITWGPLELLDEQTEDRHIVQWAIDRLKERRDKPLFLACGLHKPHMPWQVPRKYFDLHPLDQVKLPEVPPDDLADVPPAGVKAAAPQGDHANVLRSNTWRQAVQAYLACGSYADAQIGRLLDALDADPALRGNTIVVLWGDHGWHLGEKQHWRKFALWEEATRTPLIIAAPGVAPGRVAAPLDLVDLYPTLVEMCGLPAQQGLEGTSLVPLFKDPRSRRDRPALTTHGRSNHALRSDRWRYISYADGSEELYDHDADPNEWKNLAADPAYAAVKQELSKWLPKEDAPDAPARQAPARRQGRR